MPRAVGARAQLALAFETTYGTPPAGGFTRIPFASATLGAEQPLLSNASRLGALRHPPDYIMPILPLTEAMRFRIA